MRTRATRTFVTLLAVMTIAGFGALVSSTGRAQAQPASPHHMAVVTTAPHHHPDTMPATQPSPHVEYYCPMHPNVAQTEPGKCPICGMTLVQRPVTALHTADHAETMPSSPHHTMH